MSSDVGSSGVNVSSRDRHLGSEDPGEGNSNSETYTPCFRGTRPAEHAGEGGSSSVEQLARPALPGRKAYRKTCSKDIRGRWREGNQDREEERQSVGHVAERDRGKQRQRKSDGAGKRGDGSRGRAGRESSESLSSSNSDVQLNSTVEAGGGSNSLQRGHPHPGPSGTWPAMRSLPPSLPQTTIQSRSTPSSPQRLSFRTSVAELHHFSSRSPRELDPFWMDVRAGAATRRSQQSHHTQTPNPSRTSSEIGEEEEEEEEEDLGDDEAVGSRVMEMASQSVTPAAVPSCVPLGERRISKREKNRMKCLRRRQRRRERWRQSQLQESRQVNDTVTCPSTQTWF